MPSPDFHALLSQLPTKMVGIAVFVAPATQFLKLQHPSLSGWRALALNFGLTSLATLATCQDPAQAGTAAFWGSVVASSLTAAGIHGTGKSLGVLQGLFSLPPEDRDPLKFSCPHVENDAAGRPCWSCPAGRGETCTNQSGVSCPPHIERLALVEGGGGHMTEGQAAQAAADADIAPLLSAPAPVHSSHWYAHPVGSLVGGPLRIVEHMAENLDPGERSLVDQINARLAGSTLVAVAMDPPAPTLASDMETQRSRNVMLETTPDATSAQQIAVVAPVPATVAITTKSSTTWLQKAGGFVRKMLGIAVTVAQEAEPIVDVAVPEVALMYNGAVGLAVAAEATYGSTPGNGAAKLSQVLATLPTQAAHWAEQNGMQVTNAAALQKWASAIADSLNLFPFEPKPTSTTPASS